MDVTVRFHTTENSYFDKDVLVFFNPKLPIQIKTPTRTIEETTLLGANHIDLIRDNIYEHLTEGQNEVVIKYFILSTSLVPTII